MIEPLIFEAICEIPVVQSGLARYGGKPAVFLGTAPGDADPNWDSAQRYPRIEYRVDRQQNSARRTAGTLLVNVWGAGGSEPPESGCATEEIGAALQTELPKQLMTDESGTYSALWDGSEHVEAGGKMTGDPLTFDLLAFPNQETALPDPVWAVNTLIKSLLPEAKVIGRDPLARLWKPTEENPAVYARVLSGGIARASWGCAWLNAALKIHVLAPAPKARLKILQMISRELHRKGEAITEDGSPFFFQKLQYSIDAHPLREGQMTIEGEYGVLHPEAAYPKLEHPFFERRG